MPGSVTRIAIDLGTLWDHEEWSTVRMLGLHLLVKFFLHLYAEINVMT